MSAGFRTSACLCRSQEECRLVSPFDVLAKEAWQKETQAIPTTTRTITELRAS
jgi:hypothetical protein